MTAGETLPEISELEIDQETKIALQLIADAFAPDPEKCRIASETDAEGRTIYSFVTEAQVE